MPNISEENKVELDSKLIKEEIGQVIDRMKAGKRAGPDGIPVDLYKNFKDKFLVPLLNMFIHYWTCISIKFSSSYNEPSP